MSGPSGRSRRWIIVADSPFLPADGGGEAEHDGFVRTAAARGLAAAVVIPAREPLDTTRYAEAYPGVPVVGVPRRSPIRSALHPRTPYVVRSRSAPAWLVPRMREVAPRADGIVIFSYKSHALGHELSSALGLPAVLRQHNIEGDYHRDLARSSTPSRRLPLRIEAWRIGHDERRLEQSSWLRGIADISQRDADARRQRATVPVVHVAPFALAGFTSDVRRARTVAPQQAPAVLFLAALDVQTNVDALAWFCTRVWPQVTAAHGTARLVVVGRRPGPAVRAIVDSTPATELHADVGDTAPFLQSAAVAVNPAVSGSGINIKLVEYLMSDVPVVSTTRGSTGLGLQASEDMDVADRPRDFAMAVLRLLTEPERAAAMGRRGGQAVRRLVDPVAGLQQIGSLLDDASAAR